MYLTKEMQLHITQPTTKVCEVCQQELALSLFSSKRAKVCQLCKLKAQQERIRERLLDRVAKEKDKQRVLKEKKKTTLSQLKKSTQTLVNKYIRLRDRDKKCISCQVRAIEEAGHYIAQGASGALRFNLDNIHGQCTQCNHFKSGNSIEYRIHLVKKIGEDRVRWLEEHRKDVKKWTRDELSEMQEDIKQKIKTLQER